MNKDINKWSKYFNIKYPDCSMCSQCCRCASPSTPADELIKKASENNDFAKDFFSIFIPYKSLEEARENNPEIVNRSLNACNSPDSKVNADNIVFYHCRYISDDNKCLIHEDRPQLCRDYPDSPFLIFAEGCSYEKWSKQCKDSYYDIQEQLKKYKKELNDLKYQQKSIKLLNTVKKINNKEYNFILFCPSMSLVSPGVSWIKLLKQSQDY